MNKNIITISLIVVFSIIGMSLLTACDGNKEEDLADKLYGYKMNYLEDEEEVIELVKSLKFSGGYEYDKLSISTGEVVVDFNGDIEDIEELETPIVEEFDDNPTELSITFQKNDSIDPQLKEYPDFITETSILFALVKNLNSVVYITQDLSPKTAIEVLGRKDIDNMTTSVLGMNSKEIGKNKKNFRELVKYYQDYMKDAPEPKPTPDEPKPTPDEPKPPKPLEPIKPGGQLELDEIINTLSGVKMSIKSDTKSENGLTLIIENNSMSNYNFNEEFLVQRKTDGKWEDLEIEKKGRYVLDNKAINLMAKETKEVEVIWQWLYESLEPGSYRIVKTIFDDGRPGKDGIFYLGAEFEIE